MIIKDRDVLAPNHLRLGAGVRKRGFFYPSSDCCWRKANEPNGFLV